MQKVTMKMVAERAGVSIGTVDRALNGRGRIRQETKEAIVAVAKALNYQPNKMASALSRKKNLRLGVLLPRYAPCLEAPLKQGVESAQQALLDYGTQIQYLYFDSPDPAAQGDMLRKLDVQAFDGLAVSGCGPELAGAIDALVDAGLPVVTFHTDAPPSKRAFYVGEQAYQSGRLAAELMSKLLGKAGSVAVLGGRPHAQLHAQREEGFLEGLRQFAPQLQVVRLPQQEGPMAQLLLQEAEGIFCVSAVDLAPVGRYLRQQRRQVCLIGYDVSQFTAQLLREGYCSALLFQDPQRQSYEAVSLLNKMLSTDWQPSHPAYFTKPQILLSQNVDDYVGDPEVRGILP